MGRHKSQTCFRHFSPKLSRYQNSSYLARSITSRTQQTSMSKIRWGVLSTAKIGRRQVIPATQRSQLCAVTAIASRDLARAKSVAAELGIEKSYGSYQELLADRDIDAVYIPLPNHL